MEGLGVLCQVHMHGATAAPHTARPAAAGDEGTVQEVCRRQQAFASVVVVVCRVVDSRLAGSGGMQTERQQQSRAGGTLR